MTKTWSIKNFISVLMNKNNDWANAHLALIGSLSKKNDFFSLIEEFRNYIRINHSHRTHTFSLYFRHRRSIRWSIISASKKSSGSSWRWILWRSRKQRRLKTTFLQKLHAATEVFMWNCLLIQKMLLSKFFFSLGELNIR